MKRLHGQLLLLIFALFFVITSCSDKDDPSIEKNELISATYSPTSNKFTLKYSEGTTQTVDAIVDNTVSPPTAKATLKDGTVISVNDASIEGEAKIASLSAYKYVNDWIFERMNIYYLWNDMLPKKPDFTKKPTDFFDSLLNKYNETSNPKGDRFSVIRENYVDLINSLKGVSSYDIGFDYKPFLVEKNSDQVVFEVLYPKKGTDAYAKGIDRGMAVTAVDGVNITINNFRSVLSGASPKVLTLYKYADKEEKQVTIQMAKDFAENPIYMDSVYTIGDKKVGYLVYNFFSPGKDDGSYSYDKQLMASLAKMQGATELVLDLRYNSGGSASSAVALASTLVKDRSTDNVLTINEYNSYLHQAYKIIYKADDYNIDYFIDTIYKKIYNDNGDVIDEEFISDVPALNIQHLYVLVSDWTASASELIINGLLPYMDVTLIGTTTVGKNVGSFVLYEKDDSKNKWGMLPITFKYYNREMKADFYDGFDPDFEINEFKYQLIKLGEDNETLLSKAFEEIAGSSVQLKSRSTMSKRVLRDSKMIEMDAPKFMLKNKLRFELYDDIRGERINNMIR